jgi:predicted signal transduction protein with EAL and GGDEF domain
VAGQLEEDTMSYWFCLTHGAVEPDEGCAHAERLGPYPDVETAQAALDRAHKRSEAWDHDVRWNDDDLDD